jgi:hypothetical protein
MKPVLEYEHDLYFSYPRSELVTNWVVEQLLPLMQEYLELELGRKADVFLDQAVIATGQDWANAQRRALLHSRLLLAIWSPAYFASRWCFAEFTTFLERSNLVRQNLIIPLAIHGGQSFPTEAKAFQWANFQEFMIIGKAFKQTPRYVDFQVAVRALCQDITRLLENVPPFNPDWPIAEPKDAIIASQVRPLLPF